MELQCQGQRKTLADNFKKIHDLNNNLVRLVLKDQDTEAINSKLVKIWKKNKKLRFENEEFRLEKDKLRLENDDLRIEKDKLRLENDNLFTGKIENKLEMHKLEIEKFEISQENDDVKTINENLELTVEYYENQEKAFKKKMMKFIEHAPNVDRCAKRVQNENLWTKTSEIKEENNET